MPTGLTADIYDGKDTSFRNYALVCARQMGFLARMRDSAHDAKIPESFPHDDYHDKALVDAEAGLANFLALTDAELKELYVEEDKRRREANHESLKKAMGVKDRYEAMLNQVYLWECPREIIALKNLMISQLENSIDFDSKAYTRKAQTYDEWYESKKESFLRDVKYHTENAQKTLEREESVNEALRLFLDSLPEE